MQNMKHIIKMVWREWFLKRKNKEYLTVDQCNNNSAKIAVEKLGQQEGSNSELSWDIQSVAVKPKLRTKRKSRYVRGLQALISCGAACLVLGVFTLLLQPYDLIFKIAARLTEGSETYDLWKKPPVELYLRVYVFNVTNREEFLTKGEKLKVEEVGPFVYREALEQTQIEFLKNGSVNSIPRHPLYFLPELSGADENVTVIVPNVALLGMGNILRKSSIFHKLGFNILARQVGAEPLIEMSAREFMFGYDDPLVGLGNKFLTSWIYFDKLGLIDRMYDFGDDVINSYTGEVDFNKTGLLHTYNGMTHLPHWGTSDKCNRIDGASGCSKFANRIGINDSITIYHKPLCRPMSLYRISEEKLEGMKAYRYRFMDDAMDNGQLNPEYECYCQGVNEGNCLPHGLIDITPCFYGFPIALSYPHFYSGDPSLLEHVDGLSPDQSLHDSFFLIQPDVGLPLEVAVRTQINIALKTMPGIAKVSKFENKVLPLLWSESRMYNLPRSLMTRFIMYFSVLPMFQQAGIYCLISFGIAALLAGVLGMLCRDETGKPGLRNETPYRSLLTISSSSSSASDTSETSEGSTETCSDV